MAKVKAHAEIRPWTEQDYPIVAAVRTANFPHNPVTADTVRFWWEMIDPRRFYSERYIAWDAETGAGIGFASFRHNPEMFHPHKYECSLLVHPDHQRRGVGGQLADLILRRLEERQAILARATAWEAHPHALAFAARHGFAEKRRTWQSILHVGGVDVNAFADRLKRFHDQGFTVTTFADARRQDPEILPRLYRIHNESLRHTPLPDKPTDLPYDMYLQWTDGPKSILDAHFIARDGDEYIGVSILEKSDEDGVISQGLTATAPAYMGRGVAWALKLHTVKYAQDHGYARIKTWNDTENQPMLSINLRLGFEPLPAYIVLEKDLPPGPGPRA